MDDRPLVIVVSDYHDPINNPMQLGESEYSYHFVLEAFRPVLERLGLVVETHRPAEEADALYDLCTELDRRCVFLSFRPPNATALPQHCPTACVFAWEFYDLPTETWCGNPNDDWRRPLSLLGYAITHARLTGEITRRALGVDFPVLVAPAPVWDHFAHIANEEASGPVQVPFRFPTMVRYFDSGKAVPVDERAAPAAARASATFELDPDAPEEDARPSTAGALELDGVVYTSVLNPFDGRKNWLEILRVFCVTFRECDDATLVLKFAAPHSWRNRFRAAAETAKCRPFRCRVVMIDGYLSDDDYATLLRHTTYVVNAAKGEGQCLPLIEYMSAGKPAVAPPHTGMADYLDAENAFLVDSSREPAPWPRDQRRVYRTWSHRIDLESLQRAFQESYRVAHEDPERYRAMGRHATRRLEEHCSQAVIESRLRPFLDRLAAKRSVTKKSDPWPGPEHKRYSEGNEELIIRDFFRDERGGVFVDVGCSTPVHDSTTCYLERGLSWTGLAVDALGEHETGYRSFRPGTMFANFLACDRDDGTEDFYRVGVATGLSSTSATRDVLGRTWGGEALRVPTTTLDNLLRRHEIASIDFLSIDVEGSEARVLAGFDIDRYRPRLVCIEHASVPDEILAYFAQHNYERIEEYRQYDAVNWYFRPR